jgi:hypothetical protein
MGSKKSQAVQLTAPALVGIVRIESVLSYPAGLGDEDDRGSLVSLCGCFLKGICRDRGFGSVLNPPKVLV